MVVEDYLGFLGGAYLGCDYKGLGSTGAYGTAVPLLLIFVVNIDLRSRTTPHTTGGETYRIRHSA